MNAFVYGNIATSIGKLLTVPFKESTLGPFWANCTNPMHWDLRYQKQKVNFPLLTKRHSVVQRSLIGRFALCLVEITVITFKKFLLLHNDQNCNPLPQMWMSCYPTQHIIHQTITSQSAFLNDQKTSYYLFLLKNPSLLIRMQQLPVPTMRVFGQSLSLHFSGSLTYNMKSWTIPRIWHCHRYARGNCAS